MPALISALSMLSLAASGLSDEVRHEITKVCVILDFWGPESGVKLNDIKDTDPQGSWITYRVLETIYIGEEQVLNLCPNTDKWNKIKFIAIKNFCRRKNICLDFVYRLEKNLGSPCIEITGDNVHIIVDGRMTSSPSSIIEESKNIDDILSDNTTLTEEESLLDSLGLLKCYLIYNDYNSENAIIECNLNELEKNLVDNFQYKSFVYLLAVWLGGTWQVGH